MLMLRTAMVSALVVALAAAPALGKPKAKSKPKSAPKPAAVQPAPPPPKPVVKLPPARTDAELAARLHEMARAKGVYLGVGRDFCIRLGSRPVGNCEVFRAVFSEGDRVQAVFYSNNDARKNALHLFITSYLAPNYVDDFRLGLDGNLQRAVRHHGDATSRVDVRDAVPDFKRAMDFLREKQDALTSLPDAKLLEDGSCPAGKVKRVPSDEKQSACVDRARLEASAR